MTNEPEPGPALAENATGIRTLWLIRHGDALAPEAGQLDLHRPLSPLGERNAVQMAERLVNTATAVGWLWVSPSTRTRNTAAPLQQALAVPSDHCVIDERIYLADAQDLLGLLRSSPVDQLGVALIGHNPGISLLAQQLSGATSALSLPPLGCLCLQSVEPLRDWSSIAAGRLTQTALLVPDRGS